MQKTLITPNSPDTELVAGCCRRERLAQQYLYQRYYGKMLGICMRYTGNRTEAEDVLNRAFLKIFQHIGEYREQGSLHGWLATIVLRTALDYVRSQAHYRHTTHHGDLPDQPFDADTLDQLAAEELYQLIQKLPPNSRAVFSMNVVEGYTHQEISEHLGINVNTSKWYLSEAKKQLRTWLTECRGDLESPRHFAPALGVLSLKS
jgi:RNA polymerase sigma-70 factor (ECF subfamily)